MSEHELEDPELDEERRFLRSLGGSQLLIFCDDDDIPEGFREWIYRTPFSYAFYSPKARRKSMTRLVSIAAKIRADQAVVIAEGRSEDMSRLIRVCEMMGVTMWDMRGLKAPTRLSTGTEF